MSLLSLRQNMRIKRVISRVLLLVLFASCASFPFSFSRAFAADSNGVKERERTKEKDKDKDRGESSSRSRQNVAIIDVQRILQEATVAKSVQQQLESFRSKFQTEIAGEERELRESEKELVKARETTSPEVFAEREQALRQRFLAVERHVQARRKGLDQATTDSMNKIKKEVLTIVEGLAKERDLDLVLLKQQVLWSDGQSELTDAVLSELEKKMPRLDVEVVPQEEQEKIIPMRQRSKIPRKP